VGVRKPCKESSPSVLSCIGKRTKEGCDYGSEVGTVQNGRDEKVPVPLRKSRQSWRRVSCENEPKERAQSKVITLRNLRAELNERGVPVKVSKG